MVFFFFIMASQKKSWKPNGDSDMLLSVSFPPLRQNSHNTRVQMDVKFEKKSVSTILPIIITYKN